MLPEGRIGHALHVSAELALVQAAHDVVGDEVLARFRPARCAAGRRARAVASGSRAAASAMGWDPRFSEREAIVSEVTSANHLARATRICSIPGGGGVTVSRELSRDLLVIDDRGPRWGISDPRFARPFAGDV
jgi:hypothetical protein